MSALSHRALTEIRERGLGGVSRHVVGDHLTVDAPRMSLG